MGSEFDDGLRKGVAPIAGALLSSSADASDARSAARGVQSRKGSE